MAFVSAACAATIARATRRSASLTAASSVAPSSSSILPPPQPTRARCRSGAARWRAATRPFSASAAAGAGTALRRLLHAGSGEPLLNVVFFRPAIHWNTGNTGRTCLGLGARLHLIAPLGFSLDERQVRRAGLDYWHRVDLRVWASWAEFRDVGLPQLGRAYYFSKYAERSLLEVDFAASAASAAAEGGEEERCEKVTLVFGSEVDGFERVPPGEIPAASMVALPMLRGPEQPVYGGDHDHDHEDEDEDDECSASEAGIRSYNLSTSAAIALFESYRQLALLQRQQQPCVRQ